MVINEPNGLKWTASILSADPRAPQKTKQEVRLFLCTWLRGSACIHMRPYPGLDRMLL